MTTERDKPEEAGDEKTPWEDDGGGSNEVLDADEHDLEHALFRGAIVNAIGLFAKVFMPVFFVAVTWLFGATVAGVFVVVYFYLEMAKGLAVSGYGDGTTLFASRVFGRIRARADLAGRDESNERTAASGHTESAQMARAAEPSKSTPEGVIAASLGATTAVSLVLVLLTWIAAGWVGAEVYPQLEDFGAALRIGILALPAMAIATVTLAATKVRLRMEYEVAIAGFLVPVCLIGGAALAAALDGGVIGLVIAFVVGHVLGGLAGAAALSRFFRWGDVVKQLPHALSYRNLHRFAIPQGLTLTFNNYQTRVDVLILGAFGISSADVAFYSTGALLTTLLREVRVVFSAALGPIVARLHAARDTASLEALINRLSRLTVTLVVPPALLLVLFRTELLLLIDESFTGDNRFMVVLLIAPLASSAMGLAGNCISYTGHSMVNLFNALFVSVCNTVLNVLWIPDHGMMGAATATAISGTLLSILQMVELRKLEGVRLLARDLYHPFVASVPLVAGVFFWWDVADLSIWQKVVFFVGSMLVFGGSLLAVRHPEIRARVRGPQ